MNWVLFSTVPGRVLGATLTLLDSSRQGWGSNVPLTGRGFFLT